MSKKEKDIWKRFKWRKKGGEKGKRKNVFWKEIQRDSNEKKKIKRIVEKVFEVCEEEERGSIAKK